MALIAPTRARPRRTHRYMYARATRHAAAPMAASEARGPADAVDAAADALAEELKKIAIGKDGGMFWNKSGQQFTK